MKECLSDIIPKISLRGSRREFISRLLVSLTIVVSLNLPSSAEEGLVYPDSAGILFDWSPFNDTITVTITNQSSQPVTNLFISDFTDSATAFISCVIDGINQDSLPTDLEYGSVYANRYTSRWIIGDFLQEVILQYYCPLYNSFHISFSAGHPFPVFGTMPGIGKPREVSWQGNAPE